MMSTLVVMMIQHSHMMPCTPIMIMHDHHLPAEAGRQKGGQHEQERHAANQMMSERLHRCEKLALALGQHNR